MNNEEKKKTKGYPPYDADKTDDSEPIVSTNDCTGLQPTPPASQGEAEAYGTLFNIAQPTEKVNNNLQNVKKNKKDKR